MLEAVELALVQQLSAVTNYQTYLNYSVQSICKDCRTGGTDPQLDLNPCITLKAGFRDFSSLGQINF